MLKPKSIIFVLAFALLIQNTCPLGAAGKSTVAASCGHCPLKHHFVVSAAGQKNIAADPSAFHFPLYVFAVPKTIHTLEFEPVKSAPLILAESYKDALPDELLRPPQA